MQMSMQQIDTTQSLRQIIAAHRELKRTVGLVPTMGALHAGHAALIRRAAAENGVVIVSDFVNPTQFNNPMDLRAYPRQLSQDAQLVKALGADILFAPSVEEMYPEPDERVFDLSPLDSVMEGAKRPGHFNGVAQIVSRLLTLVMPDRAYFGEKDYQQLLIVQRLVKQLELPVEIVPCPIVREEDGLAMSSRNQLLSAECRREAPRIQQALRGAADILSAQGIEAATQWVTEEINRGGVLQTEYVSFASADDLMPMSNYVPGVTMGFVAVQAGNVRLIDNCKY